MQVDGTRGERDGSLPLDESDFEDPLLREAAGIQAPFLAPRPGERMGGRDGRRFEILEELGGGGMGLVFRARDEELQRVVALKFLLSQREVTELALSEARAIAQLDHENIVRIFDVAEWSPGPTAPRVPFLVMECLVGESLADLLARERPDLPRALDIMVAVASGLAHAHEHHVIHRDLKPSNVFLSSSGTVKLLDFGLAHLEAQGRGVAARLPMGGTPAYMAPEQWRGERQDARTDIWAAGVLLYELLTGELPYVGASPEELRARVLAAEPVPSPRVRHPELPWALEPLLAVALAKQPDKRLLRAAELRDELRELTELLRPGSARGRALVPLRRQVTLVCCELMGLSGLSAVLDPEDFGELEAAFHGQCSDLIHRHGGFIALCLGAEVLACFGYPVMHEEDSERAVRAGLLLAEVLPDSLRAKWVGLPLGSLTVRVGIRTDNVVLDDTLPELGGHTLALRGEAPRVAVWLAQQAEPGEVVIGDTTHRLVSPIFETVPLGVRAWEGTRPLALHRVVRARDAVLRFERALAPGRTLSPLVGREREVRVLLDQWERARRGQGGFLLVEGEAGIGKSRLLQELQERVSVEEVLCLRLQCWSQFNTSAFHPLIEELRRLWVTPEVSPREALRAVESWLEGLGLTPSQVLRVASLLGLPVHEDAPLTPERQREETLEALATLLRMAAGSRPVLVVVEDLHWTDPSTLQLLGFLLERVRESRVLGVLSARPEFQPPWPRGPGFEVLTLERLPAESTARLARAVAGERVLPEEVVAELVARTDGIPLFVEELTRLLLESASDAGSIPITLQQLLLEKLDLLPRQQKSLAQVCAVVGRSFSRSLLERLVGDRRPALERELAGLMLAGLLQRQELPGGDGYQFRHALFQEAALQELTRRVRRQHHRHIARVLEEHFPEVAEDQPELLAHHYTEAGEVEPALRYWKRAGLRASERFANLEAVSHLTQALKLLAGQPDTPWRAREELRLLLALGLPLVQVKGYSAPEVERTYVRAWELLPVVGDALPGLELSFWGIYSYFLTQTRYREAHALAERLVELGGRQQHRQLLAAGHRMMAYDFISWGRMAEGLEHIARALEYSEADLEEHRVLAVRYVVNPRVVALAFGALAYSAVGPLEVAVRHAGEARALARRIGHPHTLAYALHYSADASQFRGDAAECLRWAEECIAVSREHRFRLWALWSSLLRSWALAWLGRPEEGLALMREALAAWRGSGLLTGKPHNLGLLADIHLRLGQAREGLVAVEEALEPESLRGEHFYESELYRIRGELLWLLGREEESRASWRRAMHVAHAQGAYAFEARAREAWERPRRDARLPGGGASTR